VGRVWADVPRLRAIRAAAPYLAGHAPDGVHRRGAPLSASTGVLVDQKSPRDGKLEFPPRDHLWCPGGKGRNERP